MDITLRVRFAGDSSDAFTSPVRVTREDPCYNSPAILDPFFVDYIEVIMGITPFPHSHTPLVETTNTAE